MTENKRFILVEYVNKGLFIQDNGDDKTQYFQGSKASLEKVVSLLNQLNNENEQLKQFKENVIKWVDSQMKFNVKKYIETEDSHFKSENIDLHNFKVFIGIDSND